MIANGRCSRSWPRVARTAQSRISLSLTVKTVEGHVALIFSKLGLEQAGDDNRRVLAVITFLRASDAARSERP